MSKNDRLVVVLDKSGSMQHLTSETISGVNELIKEHRERSKKTRMTLAMFNHEYQLVFRDKKLKDVNPIDKKTYQANGYTAMLDAIAKTIDELEAKTEGKTVFVIVTDGYENASVEYNFEDIKRLVTQAQDDFGWDFLFLGANIDSILAAKNIGIAQAHAANYEASAAGTSKAYDGMRSATMSLMDDKDVDLTDVLDSQ